MTGHATRQRYSGQGRRIYVKPSLTLWERRPRPVTLIALFQFAKAGVLLLVLLAGRFDPDLLHTLPLLPSLIYVAAHGRPTNGIFLPVVTLFVALVGWGLWRLKPWARRSLIVSTALMLAVWARRFYVDWSNGETTLKTVQEQQTVYVLLFFDVVVFLYLVFYEDVPVAFTEDIGQ